MDKDFFLGIALVSGDLPLFDTFFKLFVLTHLDVHVYRVNKSIERKLRVEKVPAFSTTLFDSSCC